MSRTITKQSFEELAKDYRELLQKYSGDTVGLQEVKETLLSDLEDLGLDTDVTLDDIAMRYD